MRIVVQRVSSASVQVAGATRGSIGTGLLVLLGIEPTDQDEDIEWLAGKLVRLRIFDNAEGVMDESALDGNRSVLLVSQFTLLASTRKGNRPSWHRAAPPEVAGPIYHRFHRRLEELLGRPVATGVFGAEMQVALVNEGPVTLMLDSRLRE
ncbi:MAG: D-tyrosyl-tRNA(Tyr) deacylase [Verrucomicrobiales bacterium]|nr:D-tyrosyl-tRNA(Tyr) deacylase [Verrucomicrobiales bacterium]